MVTKKLTEKQKREKRNEYSRKWKAAHAKKVKMWNKAWADKQKKSSKKKAVKKTAKRTSKKKAVIQLLNEAVSKAA